MTLRAQMTARLPYMKAVLEDPDKRAERMRASRSNYQRIMPRLAEHLGLSDDQYDRLLELLAEQEMRYLELSYQCALTPNCERPPPQGLINERELSDLLGHEKGRQFSDYRDNLTERGHVSNMRGDLPDALRMTDVQAEKLVAALGEERRRMLKEWEQRGAGFESMNSEYGEVSFSSTAQGLEQREAEASELQRRQHDRAAQILTAGQLKVFGERQATALEQARSIWPSQVQEGNTQ